MLRLMMQCKWRIWIVPALVTNLLNLLGGCASHPWFGGAVLQRGESILLAGAEPANLEFEPLLSKPFVLRSTYREGLPRTIIYEPGRDYLVTPSGQISRAPGSRIPDFATNILYRKEDFRHEQFPGFGNGPFFVYADYWHREKWVAPAVNPELGARRLPQTRKKLLAGGRVRIVAFGDSITAGGDASEPSLIFWARWAASLRKKYAHAVIEAVSGATGGDTSADGLQRLQEKVLAQRPDLVLIGFGMNDHNREGYGVPLDALVNNLRRMIDQIRSASTAEVILFSAFPPNPNWHYGTHNMQAYAEATEKVALEKQCAYADVYRRWMSLTAHKKPEDLLANNINHPNDYGHWIYFQALEAMGL